MKRTSIILLALGVTLSSCNSYTNLLKSTDYDYKYEVAKSYYAKGLYNKANFLLSNVVVALKGSDKGEECLFLLGESAFNAKDYDMASTYYKKYASAYPKGIYAEMALYKAGLSLAKMVPNARLDQTPTYEAIAEFSLFLETYPTSPLIEKVQKRIFELQDILVEKEYLNAKLYYDLGSYIGNGINGNYEACITSAENAIKKYPYSKRRESLAWLILKAKFDYAKMSVKNKQAQRYADAIEEYYGFMNEYPESEHIEDMKKIFENIPSQYISNTKENNIQ